MTKQDWQPIETAPKDGTRILIYWPSYLYEYDGFGIEPGEEKIAIGWWFENPRLALLTSGYFHDQHELDDCGLAHPAHAPTHWMPLPELTGGEK